MAVKFICADCKRTIPITSYSNSKNGVCRSCWKKAETMKELEAEKNKAA